ncbi:MAG: hypothetical protein N3F04_04505 [Candidatus Nezhaarchaeota archaeon]|nr:hypothetical protein [Candidatus Nezhaarchaeota archaeon]MCX8142017.1 hypothetical protein [Candidatus Nezhaarchaeota archaeon]MDW8050202.1 hypothetical protein [Nitrososphaerota archaeon]
MNLPLRISILSLILALLTSILLCTIVYAQAEEDINKTPQSLLDNLLSSVRSSIDKFLALIQETFIYVIRKGFEVLIAIARASYVALGVLGLVLWATGISPYRGRHLIVGSVILALVSEVAYTMMS